MLLHYACALGSRTQKLIFGLRLHPLKRRPNSRLGRRAAKQACERAATLKIQAHPRLVLVLLMRPIGPTALLSSMSKAALTLMVMVMKGTKSAQGASVS